MAALDATVLIQPALAQSAPSSASPTAKVITSFSVGLDQALVYPSDLPTLPDEPTTFLPPSRRSTTYLVFAASNKTGGPAGTIALQTSDLRHFTYAAGYKSPVMAPPINFLKCDAADNAEFDENYSAPGTVAQDPTRPPGNLIMIYEAENHCPAGHWQRQFYATTGFARSTDFGKTWPAPIKTTLGGPDRRPVLKMNVPEPTTAQTTPIALGNAIPTAFVDTNDKSEHYLYVTYMFLGQDADGYLRVARAKLGSDQPGQSLTFTKWYNGSFSQPGIGGLDSGVTPSHGCIGSQQDGQISYDDAVGRYLLTFICVSLQGAPGNLKPYQAAWYYSTATSLDRQDWTTPQLIANSQLPLMPNCQADGSGSAFDGWYPSFMSPDHAQGHLGETGQVFFLKGCNTAGSGRQFVSRTFTITTTPE